MSFSLRALAAPLAGLTCLSIASSASAFLVEVLLASLAGNTSTIDAYRVTQTILVFGLQFAYFQALPLTLVPWFTKLAEANEEAAWRALRSIRRLAALSMSAIVIASLMFREAVVRMIAPGLDTTGQREAAFLLPCMAAAMALVTWNGITAAGLAARGTFWPGPLSSLLINLTMVAALVGTRTADATVLGLATVVGAIVGAIVHWRSAAGHGSGVGNGFPSTEWSLLVWSFVPVLAGGLASHFWNVLLYRDLTLTGTGAAATFGYALRLTILVHTPAAMLCTVLLPSLSLLQQRQPSELSRVFRKAVAAIAAFTIPAALIVALLSDSIVRLVYSNGAWNGDALSGIARILRLLSIGAPTGAFLLISQRLLAATNGNRYTMLGSLVMLGTGVIGTAVATTAEGLAFVWGTALWAGALFMMSACLLRLRSESDSAAPVLHWVCQSASPYNDYLFRSLSEEGINLLVHYRQQPIVRATLRDVHGGYNLRYYKRPWSVDWPLFRAVVFDSKSLFLTGCWQDLTCQFILLCLIVQRRSYFIWNDTPAPKQRAPWKEATRSRFLKLVFQRAHAVLGTGRPALAVFESMGCPPERLVNFPYFIDLSRFSPRARESKRSNTIILGSCGRLHEEKDFDVALRSLAALRGRGVLFEYRIAGAGPARDLLHSIATDLGIADRVRFLGWVDQQKLPEFFAELDIFVHPARHEGYCVALLEAMASGVTVVASDRTAAAADRIVDGENGFLHATNDVSSLEAAIERAIASSRKMVGQAAYSTSQQWPIGRAVSIIRALLLPSLPPAPFSRARGCAVESNIV